MIPSLLSLSFLFQGVTPELIEHARAGAAAQQQKRYDVAIQEFRKVIELQPNGVSGHANLGDAYFQSGNYEAAIPELKRALELNANLMGTHQLLGVALLIEGNAAEALPHLEKVRTPELLGLAYLETGRLGSAVIALQAALVRQPDDPDLLYYFGRATALAASRTVSQLGEIDPKFSEQKEVGAKSGQPGPSDVGRLQTALAERPADPELLFDFQRAANLASRQAFAKLSQTSPGSARAHQVAAEKSAEAGQFSDAEKEYLEALRLKPYTAGLHLALGKLYSAEGNLRKAITELRLENKLRPLNAETVYLLGDMLLRTGEPSAAMAKFARADELQANNPGILLGLGKAALKMKDAGLAERSWTKLLEIDRHSDLAAQAHFGLAGLYRSAGKAAEADREMAEYQKLTAGGAR